MTHRHLLLIPSLVLLASTTAMAADAPGVLGTGASPSEKVPGKIQGGARMVKVNGLVAIDYLTQGNYSDGNDDVSDDRSEGWYRADLGMRLQLDDRVTAKITLSGQGVMGDNRVTNDGSIYPDNASNGPGANAESGNIVLNEAYVMLTQFLNYPQLTVEVGRMPLGWNLRTEHTAFLYDSRANHPTITSWDGLRASYHLDKITLAPYVYRLPDDSKLYGFGLDWQPESSGNDRWFFTVSANIEQDVTLNGVAGAGDSLETYYVGGDANLGDFELFGEFAMQRGDQDDTTKFKGLAFSGGIDWHTRVMVLGIQADYYTGDDNPSDNKNEAFINNWEGVSDTYIVESEKYGELGRLVTGNMQAIKFKLEVPLDDKKRVVVKSVYAQYKTNESIGGAGKDFGQEADLHLQWNYTNNASFTLFAALFEPDDAYVATSQSPTPSDDLVYLFGGNVSVRF